MITMEGLPGRVLSFAYPLDHVWQNNGLNIPRS